MPLLEFDSIKLNQHLEGIYMNTKFIVSTSSGSSSCPVSLTQCCPAHAMKGRDQRLPVVLLCHNFKEAQKSCRYFTQSL
eukprot:2691712-Amphidinium_carterae.1